MKASAAAISLLLVAASVAGGEAAAVTTRLNPLSQTITLLESLSAKITKEGEEEAAAYKAYMDWCKDTTVNTGFDIKTGESKKESLEAAISKASGAADASASKIEELAASVAEDEGELKEATLVRKKEAADFAAKEAELVDVIDTLDRALAVLEREMAKNPAAFAQVDNRNVDQMLKSLGSIIEATGLSNTDQKKLLGLVQSKREDEDDDDFGAPAAAIYKTHSTSIVDVLEDLKDKAEAQLSELRKAETNANHNYEMLKQSLEDQMDADNKAMADEKAAKAEAEEGKAAAEADLARTVKDLENDKATLHTTETTCATVTANHEATVKARAEELAALAEATKILSDTTPGAVAQSYSFIQVGSAAMAHSTLHTGADLANAEVVSLVKRLAKEYHSAALAQLANRIASVIRFGAVAGEDPFAKVKSLITDLISKLEAEAGAEATEKAYCDDELAKTAAKKAELEADIAKLTSKIDLSMAKSASLKEEVQQLQAELATLAKEQADMDKLRQEGHADFVQAKADLELGLDGVRKALSVLREYYGTGEEATGLLQNGAKLTALMQQPEAPELHTQATGAGKSIIEILEVVESDFAKDLASEEVAESEAQADYEKTTQENSVTRTMKEQDVTYKTKEYKSLDKSVTELSGDRDTASTELAAVMDYDEKLKARCIAKPETYEARKARREAEINGLKEALSILENEVAFVQHKKKGHSRHFLGAL